MAPSPCRFKRGTFTAPLVVLLLCLAPPSIARSPQEEILRFQELKPESQTQPLTGGIAGVFSTAVQGTTYFGGTFWNADSMRWEAIKDSCWTFDTGVGSHFDHTAAYVDPNKDPSYHALMEGWIGRDYRYTPLAYFRRLNEADFSEVPCVGDVAGLGGDYSFWAGVLPHEADQLCYADGQGYGNSWVLCIEQTFAYSGGPVTLDFNTVVEVEEGYDFATVEIDTSGVGDVVEVIAYDGNVTGIQSLLLTPGVQLPLVGGDIIIRFCFDSDGAWSDEDGLHVTTCGAFAVDDISISGGGIAHNADFETGEDGWVLSPAEPGYGGEWSDIVHLNDLPPPLAPCECTIADSALVFFDPNGNFRPSQNNLAISPWIDLKKNGLSGTFGKFIQTELYADMPLLNYIFAQFQVQWYPEICTYTGEPITSDFSSNGFVYYFGGMPRCTKSPNAPIRIEFSDIVPASAEQMRISVGIIEYCSNFFNHNCFSRSSIYFDNIRLGVYGTPGIPLISAQSVHLPQDAFPEDGTLNPASPGRLDANLVKGAAYPEPGTSLGDTLVAKGGLGTAEVQVVFAVDPGPFINSDRLNSWLAVHPVETTWQSLTWYSARMDTAEIFANPSSGSWMTAYHEEDPNFTGTDTDLDPLDLDPNGGMTRLKNDIFPDDLFTPGTRVCLFYKTRYLSGGPWYFFPDTTGGTYLEMEVHPSSMAADSTFNCVLYVDHAGETAVQSVIESALGNILPTVSNNFEQTAWDRWDVNAPSSGQMSLGRPLQTEYGASAGQLSGYQTIIWNSGGVSEYNLSDEDANMLIPWLQMDPSRKRGLYLSGDNLAESVFGGFETRAQELLQTYCGVDLVCPTFRLADCPAGEPPDSVQCVAIAEASTPLTPVYALAGNGCPQVRSFDVLATSVQASANPDLVYASSVKPGGIAAVIHRNLADNYGTIFDGASVHTYQDPACASSMVEARLFEVLTWFGTVGEENCIDLTAVIGVPPDRPGAGNIWHFYLGGPHPVSGPGPVRFLFQAPPAKEVSVQVFDIAGRLIQTVFQGIWAGGEDEIVWNLKNQSGQRVSGGIYLARAQGEKTLVRRIVVLP